MSSKRPYYRLHRPDPVDTAVRNVTATFAPSSVLDAAAMTVRDERRDRWMRQHHLTRSRGHCCVGRLLWRCDGMRCVRLPKTDHADLWLRGGIPTVWTSQPYEAVGGDDLREIQEFAAGMKAYLSISAIDSWHFPGRTVLVALWRPGVRPWDKPGDSNGGGAE